MKTTIRFTVLLLLSIFMICFSLPCQADILSSDYSSIGDILVYDYELTSSSYMEVFQKTIYVGNRVYEYYKTHDGLRIEKFHRVCDDGMNVEELFRYIPLNKENMKTLDGEVVVFLYQYDGEKIQTIDGVWVDTFSEDDSLVNEENLYAFYTLNGRGVVCYEEYGVEGDINYIYLLADDEPPKYKVTLLPDSRWGELTEWLDNEYPTNHISFQGSSGEYITLPECTYEKAGYTFDHWWDDYKVYYPGEEYRIPNRDCSLNAVWVKKDTPVEDDKPETDNDKPSFNWFPIINQIQNNKPEPEKENDTTPTPEPDTYICPYKDISGHWAEDIIKFIDELGLIDGITVTQFQPNEPMTREMFVTAVARLAGVESNYVSWAINNGILLGYGNGEYGLTDTVTREQMAVFFLRYFEKMGINTAELRVKDAYTFADNKSISDWAAGAVYEIQMIGLIQGKENNLFDPQGTATRAEAATVLYNLIQTIMNNN